MRIVFTKLEGDRHEIDVFRDNHRDLRRPAHETGPTIPHDMVHAVVEEALRVEHGFWNALAKGAMFESFRHRDKGSHRRSGLRATRDNDESTLLPAEIAVSWIHRIWSGQRTEGRGLPRAPELAPDDVKRACAALDNAKLRWDALKNGESLEWKWPEPASAKRG